MKLFRNKLSSMIEKSVFLLYVLRLINGLGEVVEGFRVLKRQKVFETIVGRLRTHENLRIFMLGSRDLGVYDVIFFSYMHFLM